MGLAVAAPAAGQQESVGPAAPKLIERLTSPDKRLRKDALEELRAMGAKARAMVPGLARLVQDEEQVTSTRRSAAQALAAIAGDVGEAFQVLLDTAKAGDRDGRNLVLSALLQARPRLDRAAVPTLTPLLTDQGPALRVAAAVLLGRMGAEARDAVPSLIVALGGDRDDASYVAGALVGIGKEAPEAVDALARALKTHPEASVRALAAETLGAIGPQANRVAADLIEAMRDESGRVREAARKAVDRRRFWATRTPLPEDAVAALVLALQDDDESVRDAAVHILFLLRSFKPWPSRQVVQLLDHEQQPVRRSAARLVEMASGGVFRDQIPALLASAGHDDRIVREAARRRLTAVQNPPEDAVPALAAALLDQDRKVRQLAWRHLSVMKAKAKAAVPALLEQLHHEQLDIRRRAANLLYYVAPDSPEAVPGLIEALDDEDGDVRGSSGAALAAIGREHDTVIPAVVDPPETESQRHRWAAIRTLGRFEHRAGEVVPVLLEIIKVDDDRHIRAAAARALGEIGPAARDAVPVLIERLREGSQSAAIGLGGSGPDAAAGVPALIEALASSSSRWVRSSAAEALGRMGRKAGAAVPILQEALRDKDRLIRSTAAEALGGIGTAAAPAAPDLIELLRDEDVIVREHAADALGRIEPDARSAVPALVDALADEYGQVREAALRALGRLGPAARAAVPALERFLQDHRGAAERSRAEEALRRIRGDG
jgi:HEAT repeat protein